MAWPPQLLPPALGDTDFVILRDLSREAVNGDSAKRSGSRRALLACILSGDESGQDPLVLVLGRLGLDIRSEQHGRWRIHCTGDPASGILLDRQELELVRH